MHTHIFHPIIIVPKNRQVFAAPVEVSSIIAIVSARSRSFWSFPPFTGTRPSPHKYLHKNKEPKISYLILPNRDDRMSYYYYYYFFPSFYVPFNLNRGTRLISPLFFCLSLRVALFPTNNRYDAVGHHDGDRRENNRADLSSRLSTPATAF